MSLYIICMYPYFSQGSLPEIWEIVKKYILVKMGGLTTFESLFEPPPCLGKIFIMFELVIKVF